MSKWNYFIKSTLGVLLLLQFSCKDDSSTALEVTFTGDMMLARGVGSTLQGLPIDSFRNQINTLLKSDYSIVNFEGVFADPAQQTDNFLGGYNLSASPELFSLLTPTNITNLGHANNHSQDAGKSAFQNTIQAIKTTRIKSLGHDKHPCILEKGSYRMAIFAGTSFADTSKPWHASAFQLGQAIKDYKKAHPSDYTVAYLHWGREYWPGPDGLQKEWARTLIKKGCDAIIGHHPHVVQSIDYVEGKPVVYSLGNFIADPYAPDAQEGITACIKLGTKDTTLEITGIDLTDFVPRRIHKTASESFMIRLSQYSPNTVFIKKGCSWQVKNNYYQAIDSSIVEFMVSSGPTTYHWKRWNCEVSKLTYFDGIEQLNTIMLEGNLEGAQLADVLNNGEEELLLMIRKAVRFDPESNLRVNIFGVKAKSMKSVWLGTHMTYKIKDFACKVVDDTTFLTTREIKNDGKEVSCRYQWNEFGFELVESRNTKNEKH